VKPFGVVYHALSMVVVAIDGLATVLTGQRDYFWAAGGGGATEGQREAEGEKLARERGEDRDGMNRELCNYVMIELAPGFRTMG
jgi:hypothetical protein